MARLPPAGSPATTGCEPSSHVPWKSPVRIPACFAKVVRSAMLGSATSPSLAEASMPLTCRVGRGFIPPTFLAAADLVSTWVSRQGGISLSLVGARLTIVAENRVPS